MMELRQKEAAIIIKWAKQTILQNNQQRNLFKARIVNKDKKINKRKESLINNKKLIKIVIEKN